MTENERAELLECVEMAAGDCEGGIDKLRHFDRRATKAAVRLLEKAAHILDKEAARLRGIVPPAPDVPDEVLRAVSAIGASLSRSKLRRHSHSAKEGR